jgi:hypothetical protein
MTRTGPHLIWLGIGAFVAVIIGANAQMAYLAFASFPDCVAHARTGDVPEPGRFSAAQSSC